MTQPKNISLADIDRKRRRRRWVRTMLVFTITLTVAGLMGFVSLQQANSKCWDVEVRISYGDSAVFLTNEDVIKSIQPHLDSVKNFPTQNINLNAIHRTVANTNAVKNAGVYTTVDGRCVVEVEQRIPVVRIFNAKGESFYLDKEGFSFPANYRAAVRLPVFTGNIPDGVIEDSYLDPQMAYTSIMDDILRMALFIAKNEFWSAQIEQVFLNANGDFEAITRVGDHRVIIGDANDLEQKFKKWMAFYASTIKTKNLNEYQTINLKFVDQVVCGK